MIVFDLIIRLVNLLLVPAACAYLGIVVVDAATGNGMLHGIADGIRGLTAGVLKLILTLFTAYLTIAGGVSGRPWTAWRSKRRNSRSRARCRWSAG